MGQEGHSQGRMVTWLGGCMDWCQHKRLLFLLISAQSVVEIDPWWFRPFSKSAWIKRVPQRCFHLDQGAW